MEAKRIKILGIDDNQDNLISLKALIHEAFPDAVTLTALNGVKGLELAAAQDPDVILLDVLMPGMDGFEVCQKLKSDTELCDIPVVFITAMKGDKESRIRALECGAEAFLAKPIDEYELTAQIRAMVKIKTAHIEKRDEKARLAALVEEQTRELKKTHAVTLDLLENLKRENEARKKSEEEKRTLEQQFQQAQKLESLGVLAGGIAHDFNNILTIIMGYSSLIKMDYEAVEDHLPEIEKAAGRAAELCRQMLTYAGKAAFTIAQVDMAALVDEMVKMLRATISQKVVINHNLSAELPAITGDASQLRQIVMNLIINASEAIDDVQGAINITLAKTVIRTGQSIKDFHGKVIPSGLYACLEVSDTGCGMNVEIMSKIFEPFYTTKFTGRGLGMSAVLGIITAHNGALQLTSQPGQGTTFKIYLPIEINKHVAAESLQPLSSIPWRGNGTVLIAEDEEHIRTILSAMLEKLGFKVIEASNGMNALELYHKNSDIITLVVTDMGMPVVDGYELFGKLKNLAPELPIIVSSGFGDMAVTTRIEPGSIAGLINKPYRFDQLREVLKGVVGSC
jgi:CheY-like chemotaxis protein